MNNNMKDIITEWGRIQNIVDYNMGLRSGYGNPISLALSPITLLISIVKVSRKKAK